MSDESATPLDEQAILDIINSRNVHTLFQPVVSISTKSIVGFEAFSRGGGGEVCVIDPAMLFHDGLSADLKVSVDRLCREKALEQFKPIHGKHNDMLLFLNLNPDILSHVDVGSKVLKDQVGSLGIDVSNITIECPLRRVVGDKVLAFADLYRDFGFKLSLDNCSVDDAFSQIVTRFKPDFIKIGRNFFAAEERIDYSARTLDTLLEVAGRVGATVIAQGVECEEDSIRLLSAGVHLQQGYYYTKDEDLRTGDPAKMFFQKIITTYDKYKKVKREMVRRKKERFDATFKVVTSICSRFSNMSEDQFDGACLALVGKVSEVISMFVLDEIGEQITPRVHIKPVSGKTSTRILGSAKGVDHSMHDYVMYLDMGYEKFVTQPFISSFTGKKACIISKSVFNYEGLRYIICMEMPYPG